MGYPEPAVTFLHVPLYLATTATTATTPEPRPTPGPARSLTNLHVATLHATACNPQIAPGVYDIEGNRQ